MDETGWSGSEVLHKHEPESLSVMRIAVARLPCIAHSL
jgi:hypothetical protein